MPKLKRIGRAIIGNICFYGGIVSLFRRYLPRQGVLILYGHRIINHEEGFFGGIPVDLFEKQIAYISRHYNLIRFTELVDSIYSGKPFAPNSLTLTFDDGFRDNYEQAFPILKKFGMPATIFLAAGCIEKYEMPWPQRLGFILQNTDQSEVFIRVPVFRKFSLSTDRERRAALVEIKALRSVLSLEDLEGIIHTLVEQTNICPPQDRMLTWEQIREMDQCNVEFGAHSITHSLMAYLPKNQAWQELVESKQVLEERLSQPVRYFAFPAGSYDDELIEMVKKAGYMSLFLRSKNEPVNTHHSNPYGLHRLGLSDESVAVIATELAGIFGLLRRVKDIFTS